MKNKVLGLLLLSGFILTLSPVSVSAQKIDWLFFLPKPKNQYLKISDAKGECIVKLYNETPKHRDNYVKLAKEGFFNGTLFHRVIQNFMIQGGDPDSKTAKQGQLLGEGDLKYTIPAEFDSTLFHKKGVMAAARDDNPGRASSACQFYLVQGRKYTDEEMNKIEVQRLKGKKIPENHRKIYRTIGGAPFLDQNYTVFGEIVRGLPMVDSVAAVKTDTNNRPLVDIPMQVNLLKRGEARKLEKALLKESYQKAVISKN